ncbi:hypothetical protein [Streptomyces sp. NPDC127038]|uniref:hypothetical protein n=1 Tax=Streptomyces sp. NPDC127038 TaxID=3347114 RepID=UPI003663B187
MSHEQIPVPPSAQKALQLINAWQEESGERVLPVEDGSSLSGDDAEVPTLMVSSAAYQCFAQAVDHLHAVQALLFEAKMIHTYAPYSLLRAAVEAAGEAIWLLGPDSRQERIRRCLKRAYENVSKGQQFAVLADVQPSGRSAATRIQEIRQLATRHGIDPDGVCGRWSTQQQLKYVDELLNKGKDPSAQAVWQICSGFAHGREWATFGLLERTVQSQVGNVVQVRLSSSGPILLKMLAMTTAVTAEARRLIEERRVNHQ